MTAANIMTTDVLTVSHGSTLYDAFKLISHKKIRQIPVVDEHKKVLGVITPRTLMKAILPKYISEGMIEDVRFAPELPDFVDHIDQLAHKNVSDLFDKEFISVSPETSSMEIAALFVNAKKPVESILVVDDGKRLLGIISPWDVFKRLWDYAEKNKN